MVGVWYWCCTFVCHAVLAEGERISSARVAFDLVAMAEVVVVGREK